MRLESGKKCTVTISNSLDKLREKKLLNERLTQVISLISAEKQDSLINTHST
jgi:hypothetical protein